jgi:aldehyde:ferredoxin oxidoreductase
LGSYKNKILRIHLSDRSFTEEPLSPELIYNFIGGRGFGAKMLYDELTTGVDPLGEDNVLIFVAGPLAGTHAQSFGRWKVFFKSPLTGGYFKSSGGGHFGVELKAAGFDALVIRGIAEKPVYLWIHNGEYELRDATYLQGLDCDDTHTLIREELRDPSIRIACIGPAGEYGVKYAGIFTDRRAAARGGGGTVMGAKNLKAVAVRGNEKLQPADPEAFRAAARAQVNEFRSYHRFKRFSEKGTQAALDVFCNVLGILPTKNFQEGVLPEYERVGADMFDELRVRNTACSSCMIHCGNITKVNKGKYRGAWSEGPEYETIWAFSATFGIADIGLVVAADRLCDNLGLDTISAANTLGFAYELYERGLIMREDTGGLELTWGNGDPVLPLLRQIAYREGFGELLAEGTREIARRMGKGSERYAMNVKGLEIPGYDPRGAKAHGLNLITTINGADHTSGYAHQEIYGRPYEGKNIDRFTLDGKGEITKYNQDITALYETGISCTFAQWYHSDLTFYGNLLTAATGIKEFANPDYLWSVGERIVNLERMFNVREGFGRRDDAFPLRLTDEPLPSGPSAGQVFEQEPLLDDYYRVRGWDIETGIPTGTKLKELGLD